MDKSEAISKLRLIEDGVLSNEEEKLVAGKVADFLTELESRPAAPVVAEGLTESERKLALEWLSVVQGLRFLTIEDRELRDKLTAYPVAGSPAEEVIFWRTKGAELWHEMSTKDYHATAQNPVFEVRKLYTRPAAAEPMPASEAAKQTLPQSECNAALRAAPAVTYALPLPMASAPHDGTEVLAWSVTGKTWHQVYWKTQEHGNWAWVPPFPPRWACRWNGEYSQGQHEFSHWLPIPSEPDELLAATDKQHDATDWVPLARRLYVELFHCHQQMMSTKDENDEPMWLPGVTVPSVLADAKVALELASRFRAEGGITNDSTTNLAAPAAPADAKYLAEVQERVSRGAASASQTAQSVRDAAQPGIAAEEVRDAALAKLRDWFESQRKAISKGCGSSWDIAQCREQIEFIDAAIASTTTTKG